MHYHHCSNCITVPSDSLCSSGEVFIEAKCQCESEFNAFMKHLQIHTLLFITTHPYVAVQSINQSPFLLCKKCQNTLTPRILKLFMIYYYNMHSSFVCSAWTYIISQIKSSDSAHLYCSLALGVFPCISSTHTAFVSC